MQVKVASNIVIVISKSERASCSVLLSGENGEPGAAAARGAILAVTAESESTTIQLPGAETLAVPVPAIDRVSDDLGAGDVFAAAFFVALQEGQPAAAAAAFANAAAAVRIAGAGAGAIGDRAAIEQRLRAVA